MKLLGSGIKFLNAYKILAVVFIVTVFLCPSLFAQTNQLPFEHLTVERGLSQSSVISIAQDSTGFLWFGTKDGLNKYDAQQFEVFRNDSKNKNSLSSSQNINALLTDRKGNLWVATQRGLNLYLPETKSFKRFLHSPRDKSSLSNNTIRCLYEDRDGQIWVGTENGLNKLTGKGTFEHFFTVGAFGDGMVNPVIKAVYQDSKRNIWVGTQSGLAMLTRKEGKYKARLFFHKETDSYSLPANDITTITEDLNHNLWIGTHFKGLSLYDRNASTFTQFNTSNSGISSNIIRKVIVDRDGLLWIATLNGISIYDPVKQQFRNQAYDPEEASSLNQNSIYDIFQDKAGSVWVGTYYGGINVYHPNAVSFKVYKHYAYKNSLSSNVISALVEDREGNLWIGTEAEGLNYYNQKTGLFRNFKSQDNQNSLSSNLIKAISIDASGNLWIAAYEGGVDYYDIRKQTFKHYKITAGKSLVEKRISYLLADAQNRLWVGSRNGLFLLDTAADQFQSLHSGTGKYQIPACSITYLFEDSSQKLWISTELGVFYLPKGGRQFVKLHFKESNFLSHINIIAQTRSGTMLFGSYNEGMAYYYPDKKRLKLFTTDNGLPSNNITGIIEDNDEQIWVSTDKGIAQIGQNQVRLYTRDDGLPGNVFNYHSVLKDRKGNLYFGGYNGLVSFNPEKIVPNIAVPKVVFTNLKLFNQEIAINDESQLLPGSLNSIDKLVLSYQQNVFSIGFSALNFVKSRKNKYAYRLEGLEDSWNYVDHPTATFNNLPDGTYHLLVKGSNNDGIWSTKPARLKIVIQPPFWRTWWAYMIYLMVIAGILYLVMRFMLIKALLKREHDVHQMKLEFFTNVSHEIRTPLTLILGPLEKLIQENQKDLNVHRQLLVVSKNAKRLMRLINELMDFRKIESGKKQLNISAGNIVAFAQEIYCSFQPLAAQRAIQYEFKSNQELIEVYFDKDQLEKVIFNLLSNAFKFTPESGKISVEISLQEEHVYIRVKDNGPGIPEENKSKLFTDFYQVVNHKQRNTGTGIGLALSRSIAKLHQGNLVLEGDSTLTSFCLSLKTGNNHYKSSEINNVLPAEASHWYNPQTEVDTLIYDEVKKKASISGVLPLLLVVDDNEEVKEFIVKTLNPKYQVIAASNGVEALALAFEKIPDVIISDVMMPEMDGFEFCLNIKTDIRTRHIPVVLLTARSSDLHELDGLKNGADIYLTKPFSVEKLHLVTQNLITLHENMRAKFSQQFSLEPSEVEVESSDGEFLNKVLQLIEDNISNSDFTVNVFATEIGMSAPVLYKKINALTGMTVNNFIKSIRLKRALQLFQQNAGNISEVAYMVGFNDAKYFSKEFKKQFGQPASAFQKKQP